MIIEVDRYYYDKHGVYRWSPRRRNLAWRRAFSAFDRNLRTIVPAWAVITVGVPGSGKSSWSAVEDSPGVVIFDGVFANPALRERALDIASQRSVPVVAAWFVTPWEICVARNDLREPDRRVPNSRLRDFWNTIVESPPTLEDGFAAVRRVTVGPARKDPEPAPAVLPPATQAMALA